MNDLASQPFLPNGHLRNMQGNISAGVTSVHIGKGHSVTVKGTKITSFVPRSSKG